MRLAFSVPTRSDAERDLLYASYVRCGYDGLQLKSGQFVSSLDEPAPAIEAARRDRGRYSGLIFWGPLDPDGQAALRRVLGFAASVGSERVIFCHSYPRDEVTTGDLRGFARILSGLGKEASASGVKLSLHNHYNQPVMFPDDIDRFFGLVEPGTVGLTLDTAHMWMAGVEDVGPVIDRYFGVIDNIHLKDCRDDTPGYRLPSGARPATSFLSLGAGDMDFTSTFGVLKRRGYAGWLCVDEESGADVGTSLVRSHDFITGRMLSAAGAGGGESA